MRTIAIKTNGLGRYDEVSHFLIDSGALELKIELPNTSGEFYFVAEQNGKSLGAKLIPVDGVITLENLEAGELHAAVKHYFRGELIEVLKIEPLLLREVDKELSAMPEFGELKGEIERLKKELAAFKQTGEERFTATVEGFKTLTERQRESESTLVSFAYAVYQNLPLLNGKGLGFEEFTDALGFEEIAEQKELENKL